jgi:hypothetical protein
MKKITQLIIIFVCTCTLVQAQTNFVKNPDLEEYSKCPDDLSVIMYANYWSCPVDSSFLDGTDYFNACGNAYIDASFHIPNNSGFYQYPHSGNGMAAATFYYDKTLPAPPPSLPFNYRDYLQGRLYTALSAGKSYCVSFWVNLTEGSGYAHNKIGAYLDDGAINKLPLPPGSEITSVTPQVYTNTVIEDTANWVKIEGSFVATGHENHITIGNFATNAATLAIVPPLGSAQYSYYLIDDVSVVPLDLKADAGADRWVEQTKTVSIGRVGDSTAKGLDCKWYHKGILIDSGATISVAAAATKGIVDTYLVVQTICGVVTTDTVLVTTVGLGINNIALQNTFSVYPNPSDGAIVIAYSSLRGTKQSAVTASSNPVIPSSNSVIASSNSVIARHEAISIKVFDLLGRIIHQQTLTFSNNQSSLKINAPSGTYLLDLQDEDGNHYRERITIR